MIVLVRVGLWISLGLLLLATTTMGCGKGDLPVRVRTLEVRVSELEQARSPWRIATRTPSPTQWVVSPNCDGCNKPPYKVGDHVIWTRGTFYVDGWIKVLSSDGTIARISSWSPDYHYKPDACDAQFRYSTFGGIGEEEWIKVSEIRDTVAK